MECSLVAINCKKITNIEEDVHAAFIVEENGEHGIMTVTFKKTDEQSYVKVYYKTVTEIVGLWDSIMEYMVWSGWQITVSKSCLSDEEYIYATDLLINIGEEYVDD